MSEEVKTRNKKRRKRRPGNGKNVDIDEIISEIEEAASENETPVEADAEPSDVPEPVSDTSVADSPEKNDTVPDDEKKGIEAYCVTVKHRHYRGYYNDNGVDCKVGTPVIVDTGNGLEYGNVYFEPRTVISGDIVLPLNNVLRVATDEDVEKYIENGEMEIDAFNKCLELIEGSTLPMKLIDAEYSFDRTRLTFYFTAEDRVDFRELVKVLAATFRTRIDLRQIGIRDEARILGGFGSCGRPFCCKTFQPESCQMSIKMAKEQGLSLNSGKISGTCNRLMCCLRYEYDFYKEQLSKMPKLNATVSTADGNGVVFEVNPLTEKVKVLLDGAVSTRSYSYTEVTVTGQLKGKPKKNQTN